MKKNKLYIALSTWLSVILGIRIFSAFQVIPIVYENMATIVAVLLVYPPVILSFFRKKRIQYWRLNGDDFKKSIKWFVIVSLIVFPLTIFGNHFYQLWAFGASYKEGASDVWMMYVLTQLVLVAFPEEFFFRGYLQEAVEEVLPSRGVIFGAPYGWSVIIVSAIFAVSHSLITLQWWHVFIFFPALLFGWLKQKTGTIWAGTLFHWLCNVFSFWAAIHYG